MYLALFLEPFFIKYHITVILIAINFCLLCFLILILAVILRILIPHRQYPLIYDETFYFQAAVDMFRFDVLLGYSKSIAWPFVLSLIFKFFTPSNNVVFNTSIFFAAITVFPLFFLTNLFFNEKRFAMLSALLFVLLPYNIFWSATGETETTSLFFSVLALMFSFIYFKYREKSLLWLSIIGLALSVQFRPENIGLFVIFFMFELFFYKKDIFKLLKNFLGLSILYFVLIIPNLLTVILHYQRHIERQNYAPRNWNFVTSINNFLTYTSNLFNGILIPYFWSFLLILGFIYLFRINKKFFIFISCWFFYMIFFYFIFWMDAPMVINNTYPDYLVAHGFYNIYPPLVIFISGGLFFILNLIKRYIYNYFYRLFFIFLLFNFVLISVVPFYFLLNEKNKENNIVARYLETKIMDELHKDIPDECILVMPMERIGVFASKINKISLNSFLNSLDNYENSDCILFLDDHVCDQEFLSCQKIKYKFNMHPYKVYKLGNKEFTVYKIIK